MEKNRVGCHTYTREMQGIGYWDGLIVAAARLAQCTMLYTEDLRDGQTFDTVRIVNPFAAAP